MELVRQNTSVLPVLRSRDMALEDIEASLGRARPTCTIYARPHGEHVLQIYAGLYALHAAGRIRVRQRFAPEALRKRLAGSAIDCNMFRADLHGLLVDVEGAGLVFFDVLDGASCRPEILEQVSVYAKRAFRSSLHASAQGKLVPLGLNYSVYPDRTSALELEKTFRQLELSRSGAKRLVMALARLVPGIGRALSLPTVGTLSAPPAGESAPSAIFMARTWDPEEVPPLPCDAVREMNDLRAACIRLLRNRFGERFFGGFERSAYALKHYPDCVVDTRVSTRRRHYLRRVRAYSICVATTGLWDSIGWKFAEYVALGKAIVCEPMKFELPGPIAAGRNFLEFTTPEACAARVAGLLEGREARSRMMANNARYFAEFGAPHAVVGRVLHAALQRA